MLSIEETKALSAIDPEYDVYRQLAQIWQGWTMKTDVQQLRRGYTQLRLLQHAVKPDPSTLPYTEDDIQIPVRDGASIAVRVHKPRDVPVDGCPGFVVFHGGGFFVGDLEMAGPLCRAFTLLGGIAVNVSYRLAPENPFPIPVHDAYDALKWTAQNIDRLGINPAKGFLVGGECAGANIALAIAHLYRDNRIVPPLTGIYSELTSAVTPETVPEKYKDHFISLEQNAHAPYFMAESIEFVKSQYKPDPQSPLAYAILHPNHRGLPRTYFQACGMDPVRDCTLIMEQVWRDAGIETRIDIYPGLPHAAWTKWTSARFSKKHSEDTKAGLVWLLEA